LITGDERRSDCGKLPGRERQNRISPISIGSYGHYTYRCVRTKWYKLRMQLFQLRKSPLFVAQNALCGAGNGPGVDDRCRGRGNHRPRQRDAPWSPQWASNEFSMTYKEDSITCAQRTLLGSANERIGLGGIAQPSSPIYFSFGGSHNSIRFPSGSMIQANRP